MENQALNDFISSAKTAGVPRDQLENFLTRGYAPLPWQLGFHATARECDITGGPDKVGAGGARGPGKRVSTLTTAVFTDSGWKMAGDISFKDKLLAPDGTYTKLLGIYPSDTSDMYRVTFGDGCWVDADAEHSWKVYDNKKMVWRVKTTQEILDSGIRKGKCNLWAIPLMDNPAPGKQWTGVDPYIAGYILGNGTLTGSNVTIYTIEEDLVKWFKGLGWYVYRYDYSTCWMVQSHKESPAIRELLGRCIGDQKRIPSQLLEADPLTRLEVLRGLMDSDGHCGKEGSVAFKSVSHGLCEDVQYIVRSLGGQAVIHRKFRPEHDRVHGSRDHIFQVNIMTANKFNPFRIERKAKRVKKMLRTRRSIVAIDKIDNCPAVCFEVEHDSHLFVIKDFVVTHNSHAVFAQVTLDDCQRIPNLKFLFLRQTGVAAKESFEDLILKILSRRIKYDYNRSSNLLTFNNKSRVLLGGFQDERDIDKYIGIEYDGVAIEELNQLKRERVDKLLGSMRTSKPNWRPRLYASFNPGGLGHGDVKALFVDPYRANAQTKTRFVPSTYKENPYLNVEYTDYLEGLSGNLGKAWRDGDFDIFDGQFFNQWRHATHVVEPFEVPASWRRFRCIDHGRTAPTAAYWGAVDHDGNIYFYREHYQAGVDADLNAQKIAELSEGENYAFTVLDAACFSKTGTGETIAEIYERNGVMCEPSPKNRMAGWALFHEYLREGEGHPRMFFFSNCYNAIRTIPTLVHDERKPEDLDSKGEDHAADAISYALQFLHENKSPAEDRNQENQLLKKMLKLQSNQTSMSQLSKIYKR